MDAKKAVRRPVRSRVTCLVKRAEEELAKEKPDHDVLISTKNLLELVSEKLKDLDEKIAELMVHEGRSEADQDSESAEAAGYEDKISLIKVKLEKFLYPTAHSPSASEASFNLGASMSNASFGQMRNFKLPKVELKKFNGDLKEWLGFWSQFQKIDEDTTLHGSDKFQYLVQAMIPGTEPHEIVTGFPQTAENYPKAVKELKERFGRENLLIQVYIREILALAFNNIRNKERIPMSKMLIQLKSHLRSLDSLNLANADPSTLLFPLVESSLSDDMLRAWQRSPLSKKDGSLETPAKTNLNLLMDFMEMEAQSEQQIELASNGFRDFNTSEKKPATSSNWKGKISKEKNDVPTAAGLLSGHSMTCLFCDKAHFSLECFIAPKMSLQERRDKLGTKKACFACLKIGHSAKDCKGHPSCSSCGRKHYAIMCPDSGKKNDSRKPEKKPDATPTTRANLCTTGETLLPTLLATLVHDGRRKVVRVLCDSGAQHSYIKRSTAKELNLKPTGSVKYKHEIFGGRNYVETHQKYRIHLKRLGPNAYGGAEFDVLCQEEICKIVPRIQAGSWIKELQQQQIWLSDYGDEAAADIEILVGNEVFMDILTGESYRLQNGLYALETTLGWIVSGREKTHGGSTTAHTLISMHVSSKELPISKLWDLDTIGIMDPIEHKSKTQIEEETKAHFLKSVTRTADGRYSVKLPWIEGAPPIPENRAVAERRLVNSTRKLRESGQYQIYSDMFKSWLEEGIIEKVSPGTTGGHFIPHRPVFKPGSATTPVRPVFDASCKTKDGKSLNDRLHKGPNQMEEIPSILLRFREKKIGVISDIRKAFLMVGMDESDRNFLKFLWWEDEPNQEKIQEFRHRRVVFGVNCSPFLLAAVLEHHLKNVDPADKEAASKLLKSLYVDNCVTSVSSPQEYEEFREISTRVLADAKMELRCWEYGMLASDSPHKPGSPLKQDSHLKPGSPHKPGSPVKQDSSHKPGSPLKLGSHHQPGSPLKPDSPHKPGSPHKSDSRLQPGSPLKLGSPHQAGSPLKPDSPHKPGSPHKSDSLLQPGSPHKPGSPLKQDPHLKPGSPLQPDSPLQPGSPLKPGSLPIDSSPHVSSVLGLKWNKQEDTLSIDLDLPKLPEKITKRSILSVVHQVYDPPGFTAPAMLFPKFMLQEVWAQDVGWEDEVSQDIVSRFLNWFQELAILQDVSIPRHFNPFEAENNELSLHTFCDASKDAYAAVVFLRAETEMGTSVRLLQVKARVSPLKRTKTKEGKKSDGKPTIPRLELLAATIASRLANSTKEALEWKEIRTYYWSDSTTVIAWLQRNEDWGTFVGNRVKEVLKLTKIEDWNHVPGKLNPADLPSRGCTASQLLKSKWWEGPDWLYKSKEDWPVNLNMEVDEEEVNAEKKKSTKVLIVKSGPSVFVPQFSTYMENVRVMGWILRYIDNLRSPDEKRNRRKFLTSEELKVAEFEILKIVQAEAFPNGEQDQAITHLKVVRETGLLRVKTRLTYRADTVDFRSPVILPKDHALVTQLIRYVHERHCHGGTQVVVNALRQKYWILQSRRAVSQVIRKCIRCARYSVKPMTVEPSPLPSYRVEATEVYENSGVDLAGPLFLEGGTKCWIVLFTCAVYRAVHLDTVTSLSTEAFIASLERFINSNGRPHVIYSDNGTNFVGAANLFKKIDWTRVEEACRVKKIKWIFNPPTAAWWGGWWERLVRSVKELLRKMLGRAQLNYDELRTCLSAVEATINSRPLTTVTEDADDLISLTPMMFTRTLLLPRFPEAEKIDSRVLQRRFVKLQELKKDLQARFRKEYLALLVQKPGEKKTKPPEVGDVVLVGSDDKKRFEWPLGRIVELLPGKDDHTRTAKVIVQVKPSGPRRNKADPEEKFTYRTQILTRPLQRLYPLEVRMAEEEPQLMNVKPRGDDENPTNGNSDQDIPMEVSQDKEVITRLGRKVVRPRRYGQWQF